MGLRTSPWGAVQHEKPIAPGITQVSTASHGGIHLDPKLNAKVHKAWRQRNRWYEEDCEWAIVALTFPEHFQEPMPADGKCAGETVAEYADGVARRWMPDQYEVVHGVKVTADESIVRRHQELAAATANEVRSATAWGHRNERWGRTLVPAGWVGVAARLGGRFGAAGAHESWHLIPADEYDQADEAGVLIDPARHPEWPEVPAEEVDQPVLVHIGGNPSQSAWGPGLTGSVDLRNTFVLYAVAQPHQADAVGELWRYPAKGNEPEQWRALRRRGMPAGATLHSFATQEEALDAVGFKLPPYAEIPARFAGEPTGVAEVPADDSDDDMAGIAAVFGRLLAAA